MASPASSQRRRSHSRRQPLSRTNTFFGAIKNIVTAPLSWLTNTDDFEDARDSAGKRRRLAAVPTEPSLDEGDAAPRSKRMRVDSPPRGLQREGAYLDPPVAAFQQPPSIGRSVSTGTQIIGRHLLAGKNTENYVRSTISPLRNLSISRTMSVDPPFRSQSQDGGVNQSQRQPVSRQDTDASMESIHSLPQLSVPSTSSFPRTSLSMPRELSMSYSRPPFRMRTSLTPQPAQSQRERSEPPPLQLLRVHPTFVKPPPLEEGARASSHEPTLGSLIESARQIESPARQQSSLLFASKGQAESKSDVTTRAQRALHELEIYKTPLLPTRLRNGAGQASITGVPDLFKPRRNKLVLMKDEKPSSDRKLGQKEVISPEKNGMKPYAGAGDMKKMLAKRKLELEDEQEDSESTGEMMEKVKKVEVTEERKEDLQPSISSQEIPLPPKDDWYSLATNLSSAVGGSSLRVGRAKSSRNHISRPAARSRAKFSAAFDDDGDDAMLEQDKERSMLEEAAKMAPVFDIPVGFSFAKDARPIEHDTTNAKEPPIKSLPFSLSAAPTVTSAPALPKLEAPTTISQVPIAPPPTHPPISFGAPSPPHPEKPAISLDPSPKAQVTGNSKSVPNFFAGSAAFNKPLEIKTPPLSFGTPPVGPATTGAPATTSTPLPTFSFSSPATSENGISRPNIATTSLFNSPAPPAPVKDLANPFWDGENLGLAAGPSSAPNKDQPQLAPISIFGAAIQGKTTELRPPEAKTNFTSSTSFFGNPSKAVPAAASLPSDRSATQPSTLKPESSESTLSMSQSMIKTSSAPIQAPPLQLGQGSPALTNARDSIPSSSSTNLIFGGPSGASSKPQSSLFGVEAAQKPTPDAEKPLFPFGQPTSSIQAPEPTSNNIFSFNQTSNSETKSGSPAPFSFAGSDNKETRSSTPGLFTFGGPSTPVATEKAATPFTFGTPTSPAPPLFSFGPGGNTTSNVSKPLQVERPATPPKNAEQEFKMEESPTRDIQQANDTKPAFGGFTFGNPPTTSSVLFGGPTSAPPTSMPLPFGSSSNPFGPVPIKETKSEGPKSFPFGQPSTSATNTGFSFGQSQPTESPRPSTTGSFNFGANSGGNGGGTPTSTTSGFNFGANSTSSPFGQPAGGSAPSSPSTFQSSIFNFGAPPSSAPFSFGSQPASPATGNTNLPHATTPVTFGGANTGFGSSAPSSPFSAPAQLAPSTSSGGTLFTIGSAPDQANPQGRAIKRLPRSRATKR